MTTTVTTKSVKNITRAVLSRLASGQYRAVTWNGAEMYIDTVSKSYVMRKNAARHAIAISQSDAKRVAAHWTGFAA